MSTRPASHAGTWYSADRMYTSTNSRRGAIKKSFYLAGECLRDIPANRPARRGSAYAGERLQSRDCSVGTRSTYTGTRGIDTRDLQPHGPMHAWIHPQCTYGQAANRSRTVLVLGPSHVSFLRGCALTQYASVDTPLGPIEVNAQRTYIYTDSSQ